MLLSAGLEPPATIHVHGWLLIGGEKMSKTKLNQITPAALVADFGVDGYRYHFLADVPFGPDNDFSYEGMVARYNADLANNLGNLLSRVATVVGKQCGGIGPAPRPDSPLAHVAVQAFDHAAAAWERVQPSEALEATWRLIRAMNAELEATEPWKAEPGPAVDGVLGDALEVLRIVAVLASPAIPHALRGDLEAHRALRDRCSTNGFPQAAAWGGYPGGLAVEKGTPLFPRLTVAFVVTWTDNHCHLDDERLEGGAAEAIAAARAAGVDRMITIGTDAMRSRMAIDIAAAHDGVWATVGLHPHDAKQRSRHDRGRCSASPASWPSESAASTITTTTRLVTCSGTRSPRRSISRTNAASRS